MRLINVGCSFSYGNIISEYETFADKHISPGTLVAEYMGIEELNIASPGLSLDGVLRRLHSYEFKRDDVFLIGLPPNLRLQAVRTEPRNQNKIRKKFNNPSEWRQNAFNQGPKIPEDWFITKTWDNDFEKVDLLETTAYWSFYNILLIQLTMTHKLSYHLPKDRYWLYNSVHGHMQQTTDKPEIQRLRDQINILNYYKPDTGMHDEVLQDQKYQIARDDTHPNHIYYTRWAEEFCTWMSQSA